MASCADTSLRQVAGERSVAQHPFSRRRSPALARFTRDYVAFHARRRPHATALLLDGRAISYSDLLRDLVTTAQLLAAFGVRSGGLVAVGFDDFATQLLLMLALETLGLVAAGFRTSEGSLCADLVARADFVLAQEEITLPHSELLALRSDWLERAQESWSSPILRSATPPDDAPFMVVRSSGTTGRSKLMTITRAMEHARLRDRVRALGIGRHTRYLSTMQLGVGLNYTTVVSTLRVGGTVIAESVAAVADAIGLRDPNLVNFLPYQLAQALRELEETQSAGARRRPDLLVVVNGGKLDDKLRVAALDQLCGRLLESYGCNEGGLLAMIESDDAARTLPGVTLEVVDPHGNSVAPGASGEIRARGPTFVQEYLDDPAATATVFRHGWYYPGDLALRLAPDLVRVLGRPDDVVNMGGVKLSAVDIERVVTDCADSLGIALRDVAVLATADALAHPLLVICTTGMRDVDAPALADGLRPAMQVRFSLACITAIPRTTGGKVRRAELRRIVDAAFQPADPT